MRRHTAPHVGVLALQGGVSEHVDVLTELGARVTRVRREADVRGPDGPRIDALLLPGGESGPQDRLARLVGLADPLRHLITGGLPVLGTCAGLILLAERIEDPAPGQRSLRVLDVEVRRNAFGPQVASQEAEFPVDAAGVHGTGIGGAVRGALIRAPEIVSVGPAARTIVTHAGRVVGATSRDPDGLDGRDSENPALGLITGIAFHPELSADPAFHRALLARAAQRAAG